MTEMLPGSRVSLHLEILLEDGTEAISTFGDDPLDIRLGDGTLVPGLERLLLDLRTGADEHFLVAGSDLYGPRDAENIHWIQRSDFRDGLTMAPGLLVAFDTPGGHETAGSVLALEGDRVQVDFNHPLSGRSLQIRVKILSVAGPDKVPRYP